jgi:eukaryotic-like serine/threonine-protein kinase
MNDRQLLFGVLALQADLLSMAQFAEACSAWAANKESTLSSILVTRGWMTTEDVKLVERLLEKKLAKHAGNIQATMALEVPSAVRQEVVNILDADVAATLNWQEKQHERGVLLSTSGVPGSRDRYSTTRLHASGGLGRVWLARDTGMDRDVALKELLPERTGLNQAMDRFLREARITGQLEHPGIVPVYELVSDGTSPFYTMRFIRGRTLGEAIADYHRRKQAGSAGVIELRELLQAFVLLCQAVAYAHSRRVIHRDLKPANIVLGDFGEVILLDWGIAKVIGEPEIEDTDTTRMATPPVKNPDGTDATLAGTILGTPHYMAPEQASGAVQRITEQTDIYGLGVILYEILGGRVPFQEKTLPKLLEQVIHETPPRLRDHDRNIPASIEAVCLKCLRKSQNERYTSAKALADEVNRFLADEPVSAYSDPIQVRFGRWAKRNRTLVGSLTTLLLVAIPVLLVSLLLVTSAADRERDARSKEQAARQEAEQNFERAVRAAELVSNELAKGIKPIAGTQSQTVIDICTRAETVYDELLNVPNPPRAALLNKARMLCLLSEVYYTVNRLSLALQRADEAITMLNSMLAKEPKLREAMMILGVAEMRRGRVIFDRSETRLAMECFDHAIQLLEDVQLLDTDPAEIKQSLAGSLTLKANILIEYREHKNARLCYERGLAIREAVYAQTPSASNAQQLAISLEKLGEFEILLRRAELGTGLQKRAMQLNQEAFMKDTANQESGKHLVRSLTTYALTIIDDDRNESRRLMEQARDISATFARRDPSNNDWERQALRAEWVLGELDRRNWIRLPEGQRQAAKNKQLELLQSMLRVAERRFKESPENILWLIDLNNIRGRCARAKMDHADDFAKNPILQKQVLDDLMQSIKEDGLILKIDPANFQARVNAHYNLFLIALVRRTIKPDDEAIRASIAEHASAYTLYRDLSAAFPDDPNIRFECNRGMNSDTVNTAIGGDWHTRVTDVATIEAILDFAKEVGKPNPRLAPAVETQVSALRKNVLENLKKLDELRPLPARGKNLIEQLSVK